MNKRIILFSIILTLAFFAKVSLAADQTAASCSAVDIQTALNSCVSTGGGTVTIPACSGGSNGSTWNQNDRVCIYSTVELRIIGQGQDNTVIKYADGAGPGSSGSCGSVSGYGGMFEVRGSGFKELAHLSLSGASDIGVGTVLYVFACSAQGERIHHISLRKATGSFIYYCQNLNSYGLIDHIYIGEKVGSPYGIRIHGNNNEAYWVEPVVGFGTNNGLFIEDSVFNGTYHPVAAHGTARYTVRYNTFSNHTSALEGHGPSYSFGCGGCSDYGIQAACYSGVYRVEVYNNTFNAAGYSTFQRSGHWIITDNIYKDQTQYDGPIVVEMESSSIGTNCNIANSCPRAYGWAGVGSCNPVGKPGCWHNPHASYIWNNTFINSGGSSSNCRAQATDKACTIINDKSTGCIREGTEIFFRAPQSGDPEITTYTKFTYPHPLQTGGPPADTTPPAAPSGVTVS